MNPTTERYNPTFMAEMLKEARGLTERVRKTFMEPGLDYSAALSAEEALKLQSLIPNIIPEEDGARRTTIQRINQHYNRIAEYALGDYGRSFNLAISGEDRNLTEEAQATILMLCKAHALDAINALDNIDLAPIRGQINEAPDYMDLIYDLKIALSNHPQKNLVIDSIREKHSTECHRLEEEGKLTVTNLSSDDCYQSARYASLILFVVAREFTSAGVVSFLIQERNPDLEKDLRAFFRKFPRQLNSIRDDKVMSDATFTLLTEEH